MQAGIKRAAEYIRSHPDGWDDEPSDFFRMPPEK